MIDEGAGARCLPAQHDLLARIHVGEGAAAQPAGCRMEVDIVRHRVAIGIDQRHLDIVTFMTLAVMSRATLGHTGRALEASPATHLIYANVIVAALARVCAVLEVDHSGSLLVVAGIAWAAAFLGFAAAYSVAFWSPRRF